MMITVVADDADGGDKDDEDDNEDEGNGHDDGVDGDIYRVIARHKGHSTPTCPPVLPSTTKKNSPPCPVSIPLHR